MGRALGKQTSLMWFSQDLRLDDNDALLAAAQSDELICVYIVDPNWFAPHPSGYARMGPHRWRFLSESLAELDNQLKALGQRLLVLFQPPEQALGLLIEQFNIGRVCHCAHTTNYELNAWNNLVDRFPSVDWCFFHSFSLFSSDQLPFAIAQLPTSFSKFRKLVEPLTVAAPSSRPSELPPTPLSDVQVKRGQIELPALQHIASEHEAIATGGEQAALHHLTDYFSGDLPSRYKLVRNELDGWRNSTKFSPWLANGCLSVKRLLNRLNQYQRDVVSNESTYWIFFELLWREYFHWYGACYGGKLFLLKGLRGKAPLTSYYPQRLQQWCAGQTPFPLVNACMNQLNATGYLSNRGRQIVASCLVNELQVDWRYGASYFEHQLIDYQAAVNWGNWQYIAGVGADPRGGRHFNLAKQAEQYDANGDYIKRWHGQQKRLSLDHVDCADWPVAALTKQRGIHV